MALTFKEGLNNHINFNDNVNVPIENLVLYTLIFSCIAFFTSNLIPSSYVTDGLISLSATLLFFQTLAMMLFFASIIFAFFASLGYAYVQIGRYKNLVSYTTEKRKLIEIKLPKDSELTFASMESFFESIAYSEGEKELFNLWWKGSARPTFSFEIVSKGGIVYFYINIPQKTEEVVLNSLHAFFPEVEVSDAQDYVFDVDLSPEANDVSLIKWKFEENKILPLKTYVEFQLEKKKEPKLGEPFRDSKYLFDPIAPLFEYLGSIRGDEQIWIQYVFKIEKYPKIVGKEKGSSHILRKDYWDKKKISDEIASAIFNAEKKHFKFKKEVQEDNIDKYKKPSVLTAVEERVRNLGSRILTKKQFDVGIRMLEITPKGKSKTSNLNSLHYVFKNTDTIEDRLMASGELLKNVLVNVTEKTLFQDKKKSLSAETIVNTELYRDRIFWHIPLGLAFTPSTMVMSSEALATICHFPTSLIQTPTVRRTLSKSIDAPQNLPI